MADDSDGALLQAVAVTVVDPDDNDSDQREGEDFIQDFVQV